MKRVLTLLSAGLILALGGSASAEEDPRAAILRIEMRRGPVGGPDVEGLSPWLTPQADPAVRLLAVRALGRMGGTATESLQAWLRADSPDLAEALFWAGVAQWKGLSPVIAPHLESKDPAVRAAAAEALGWSGDPADVAKLSPLLTDPSPEVVAATLRGLARLRVDGLLERVWGFQAEAFPVEGSAHFAAWRLAAARVQAAKARNPEWGGERLEAFPELQRARGDSPDVVRLQLAWLRPVSLLAPEDAVLPEEFTKEMAPRVAQEYLVRFAKDRTSPEVERTVLALVGAADEKTRTLAVEDLAARESADAVVVLQGALKVETDARVRDAIAIALAKRGDEDGARAVLDRNDRPEDPVVRQATKAEVLAASKRPEALDELLRLGRTRTLHAAVKMLVLERLEGRKEETVSAFAKEMFADPDPYVRAAAASLVAKNGFREHLSLLAETYQRSTAWGERAARQEVVNAWAAFAKDEATPKEDADALRGWIRRAALEDPSAPVRLAAYTAAKDLGIAGLPASDPEPPNDWRGLPRPKAPLLGLEFPPEREWLDEADILRIADRIAERSPRVVFDTTQGKFAVTVDAQAAPVHAANLLICAVNGVYEGTRWHRVVPSFVIQGGDPHGDGSGDAGYSVPDEITRLPFVRGALGMPKDTKDTGGCQVFVMHSDYMPLDGRYTCYGRVVSGMEVVDRIRVGDYIRRATIEVD